MDQLSFSSQQVPAINKQGIQLRPREGQMTKQKKHYSRSYVKVPASLKQELFRMVYNEGSKIKTAAKLLNLKYATAKTLIFHQREKRKRVLQQGVKMCLFTELVEGQQTKFTVVSISGNITTNVQEYTYTKKPATTNSQ